MTASEPRATPAQKVDVEDVDDIIGLAAEMHHADEEKLTVEELCAVAAELDLPVHYVERAVSALEDRRAASRAASMRRRRQLGIFGVALVGVAIVLFASALASVNALRVGVAEVEMRRAQVGNVMDRRERVVGRLGAERSGRDEEAELSGADNRVAIEIRRYDQAASAYNAEAASFPARIWAPLFDVPSEIPLSSEMPRW